MDSSLTKRHGGAGLGLAISKKIVTLMNGDIGVESELVRGFFFFDFVCAGFFQVLHLFFSRERDLYFGLEFLVSFLFLPTKVSPFLPQNFLRNIFPSHFYL